MLTEKSPFVPDDPAVDDAAAATTEPAAWVGLLPDAGGGGGGAMGRNSRDEALVVSW